MGIIFDKRPSGEPISAPVVDYDVALDKALAGERHIQVAVHSGLAPSLAREFIAKCRELDALVVAAVAGKDGHLATKTAITALVAEKAPPPFPAGRFVDAMVAAGGGTVAKLVSACKAIAVANGE